MFLGTPYEIAPPEVQVDTLRRAQASLAKQGFYQDVADGVPGPNTARAIAAYQSRLSLARTGRLDLPTLSRLGLLPGRQVYRGSRSVEVAPPTTTRRAYRGIWVQ